eukprot:2369418-Lingulodinium_polyedra.AAC.1
MEVLPAASGGDLQEEEHHRVAWLVREHRAEGQNCYVLETSGLEHVLLQWVHILDWDDFEVVPCQAASPLHAYLASGRQLGEYLGVVAAAQGPPVSLLRHAALHAFWDLPQTVLKRIAGEQGVGLPENASLLQVLKALIKDSVPKVKALELYDILSSRASAAGLDRASECPPDILKEAMVDSKDSKEAEDGFVIQTPQWHHLSKY